MEVYNFSLTSHLDLATFLETRSQLVQADWIHSDEGLTLETSVFESFTVANLPNRPCGW